MPNKPRKIPEREWVNGLAKQISGAGVIVQVDDRVILVKDFLKDYWTFPGGVIDAGEAPLAAAVREVDEEIGLELSPADLKFYFVAVSDRLEYKTYHFLFETDLDERVLEQITLQPDEIEDYQLLTKEQILAAPAGTMAWSVVAWAEEKSGYLDFSGRTA